MKGLAPVYSYSEKCGVKGWKTIAHNPNKLEEVDMPFVRRVTLIPPVRLLCVHGLKGVKATSASLSVNM